jgi:hypothetical protein
MRGTAIKKQKHQKKNNSKHLATMGIMSMMMSLGLCLSLLLIQGTSAWVPSSPSSARHSLTTLNAASSNNNPGSNSKFSQPAFAQPAFRQAAHTKKSQQQSQAGNPNPAKPVAQKHEKPEPKPSNPKHKSVYSGGDSAIGIAHAARVKAAGRVGTKRYVNPCKVFCGNLPLTYTKQDLSAWICNEMGMPHHILLNECKIVKDWKTGTSKGFGFVVFTEAVYATVCIDKCHGQQLNGRSITVRQGGKKQADNVVYVKKNKAIPANSEESAIQQGIEQAGDNDDDSSDDSDDSGDYSTAKARKERRRRDKEERLDPYEEAIVRKLDPDLVDDRLDDHALFFEFANVEKNDDDFDVDDLDGDYDDSDDGVDGIWIEDSGPVVSADDAMNRQSRRESAKRQKRRKLPSKGFERPAPKK